MQRLKENRANLGSVASCEIRAIWPKQVLIRRNAYHSYNEIAVCFEGLRRGQVDWGVRSISFKASLGSKRLHSEHVIVAGPYVEVSQEIVALCGSRRDRCTDATSQTTSSPNSVQGTLSEVRRRCSALAVSFSSMVYR